MHLPSDPAVKRLRRVASALPGDAAVKATSFEQLIMHLATAFVNAPVERINEMIDEALRLSGRGAGVDRSYLMRYDLEHRLVCNTHEWCEEGIEPMIEHLQAVSFDGLDDFLESHLNGFVLLVSRVDMLKEGSRLRELLEPQGIQTMVAVPLMEGSRCLGFVGFDAVRHHKEWSQEEIDLLWTLAEVFINAEHAVTRERALAQAKQEAEMAERRLQRAVLAGEFAIWERDLLKEEITFVCGWNRLTGEELDGRVEPIGRFFELVPTTEWPRLRECVSDCLRQTHEQFEVDFQLLQKGGDLIDVRGRWVVDYKDRRPVRLLGSVENISQLRREQNEARKRAEVEALANVISSRFTGAAEFERAAQAAFTDFQQFTGLQRISLWKPNSGESLEEVVGHPLAKSWDRSKGDKTIVKLSSPSFLQTLQQGHTVSLGCTQGDRGSLEAWVQAGGYRSAMAVPVRNEVCLDAVLLVESTEKELILDRQDQHLLQLIAHILAGALARNQAEEKLRKNREFYWMILESLSEAVLLTTLDGQVLYANRAWASITGGSQEESMRVKLADLVHYEDVQKEEVAQDQALAGTLQEAYSLRLVTNQMGSFRWFKVMKQVVDLPILEGRAGLLITLEDDTERRKWEETLIAAKMKAENMSQAKTLYLSKASHELRTPLHGILSLLELLLGTTLDTEQRRWVESAEMSAKTLLDIFEDVLEVSKLERGGVRLQIKPTNLESLVQGVIAMFETAARDKGLELSWHMDSNLPRVVEIDELRTRQVLINLISNAVRYTAEGEVRLRVAETERLGDERVWLDFAVIDTGPGIPLHDQERLFIPFVQLENHHRVTGEGSGLGLPIVRELCRLMNADLRVESDGCNGTTMRFFLPTHAIIERAAANGSDSQPASVLQGKKVLVVEDNEISRYVAAQHLTALGAQVTTAVDGAEAQEILRRQRQDLVVTDCAMPGMNGFDLAYWIRSQTPEDGGKCPIIACTADTTLENHHQCREAGMNGVLTKPYARQQLQQVVERVMSHPQQVSVTEVEWELPSGLDEGAVLSLDLIGISLDSDPAFAQHFLTRTFSLFRQLVPEELAQIRQALRERDAELLRKRLHHLKSSAAAVGAEQLSRCCSWFEELAFSASEQLSDFPTEDSVMEPLERLIECCQMRMRELLAGLPEPN